jgi:ankyrin repeat protein
MEYSSIDASVREAARRGELGKLLDSFSSQPSDSLPSAVRRLATARDSDGRTLLFDAVVGGNVDDIRRVMGMRNDQNATASDVNMRDDGGYAFCSTQARFGFYHPKSHQFINSSTHTLSLQQTNRWSPLMSACSSNKPEAARWLLEAGAELDEGHRDVFYAASKGGVELMEAICGKKINGLWLAGLRSRGSTLLHRAAGAGNVEVCEWLTGMMRDAGIDVSAWVRDVRDGAGETVLEVVEACLEGGARERVEAVIDRR